MTSTDFAKPASRLDDVQPSQIRAIFDLAGKLESEGHDVLHFEIGRPDFDTPEVVKQAASAALDAGRVHYGPNPGTIELRQTIAESVQEQLGLSYSADGEVLVTIGANEAVFLAITAFCNPGDEVIIPVPAWPAYEACVRLAGATPVFLPLKESDGYAVNPEDLARAITPRTRMIVVCTPHNPTGAILDHARIEAIADIIRGTNILVLSDEIYSQLTYGEATHVSPATVADLRDRTLIVNGFAKAYAMDGWRLGWLTGPEELVRPALRVRQFTTTCPPTFTQDAAVAALTKTDEQRALMRQAFADRRAAAMELLAEQEVFSAPEEGGAFYLYLRYPERLGPADELALRLLKERKIALVPGSAFDPTGGGKHSLRFSYACSLDDVREGISRLVSFAEELSR